MLTPSPIDVLRAFPFTLPASLATCTTVRSPMCELLPRKHGVSCTPTPSHDGIAYSAACFITFRHSRVIDTRELHAKPTGKVITCLPTVIELTSPRRAAPYHTDDPAPTLTDPMTLELGAWEPIQRNEAPAGSSEARDHHEGISPDDGNGALVCASSTVSAHCTHTIFKSGLSARCVTGLGEGEFSLQPEAKAFKTCTHTPEDVRGSL